jgi:hypothetical protein
MDLIVEILYKSFITIKICYWKLFSNKVLLGLPYYLEDIIDTANQ